METIWKTEGPTDLLALLSLDLPEGHAAVCNLFGAQENPLSDHGSKTWMLEEFSGKRVFVIHDCDKPGQDGATEVVQGERRRPGWAPCIAKYAAECRNVVLPFEIQDGHGKDLRDWIADKLETGLSEQEVYAELLALADAAEVVEVTPEVEKQIEAAPDEIEEAEDDPHRLARLNLENYQGKHGRALRFWCEEWWRWKDGRYERIPQKDFRAKITLAIKDEFDRQFREARKRGEEVKSTKKVTKTLVTNVIVASESLALLNSNVNMPCWLEDRTQPHWVAMRNGILDLDAVFAGKGPEDHVRPHSPQWFSAFCLDYEYDPEASCPLWMQYLNMVMDGDAERIALLQEWMGYLLSPNNDLQRFMCFEGGGGNGKTVFFAAVEAMLGSANISHVPLESFGEKFDLNCTLGKSVNIDADVGEIKQVAEGKLKMFVGGDVMHFDRKNREPMSARPTAKFMCSWNNRPRMRDRSKGLWRRMILVPFEREIQAHEKILGMDKAEWWAGNGQVPGILNWAIAGLFRLRRNGDFTVSQKALEANQSYKLESNPAAEFLQDYVELTDSEEDYIETHELYNAYVFWASKMGVKPLGNRMFFKELVRTFGDTEKRRLSHSGRPWAYFRVRFTVDEIFGRQIGKTNWWENEN